MEVTNTKSELSISEIPAKSIQLPLNPLEEASIIGTQTMKGEKSQSKKKKKYSNPKTKINIGKDARRKERKSYHREIRRRNKTVIEKLKKVENQLLNEINSLQAKDNAKPQLLKTLETENVCVDAGMVQGATCIYSENNPSSFVIQDDSNNPTCNISAHGSSDNLSNKEDYIEGHSNQREVDSDYELISDDFTTDYSSDSETDDNTFLDTQRFNDMTNREKKDFVEQTLLKEEIKVANFSFKQWEEDDFLKSKVDDSANMEVLHLKEKLEKDVQDIETSHNIRCIEFSDKNVISQKILDELNQVQKEKNKKILDMQSEKQEQCMSAGRTINDNLNVANANETKQHEEILANADTDKLCSLSECEKRRDMKIQEALSRFEDEKAKFEMECVNAQQEVYDMYQQKVNDESARFEKRKEELQLQSEADMRAEAHATSELIKSETAKIEEEYIDTFKEFDSRICREKAMLEKSNYEFIVKSEEKREMETENACKIYSHQCVTVEARKCQKLQEIGKTSEKKINIYSSRLKLFSQIAQILDNIIKHERDMLNIKQERMQQRVAQMKSRAEKFKNYDAFSVLSADQSDPVIMKQNHTGLSDIFQHTTEPHVGIGSHDEVAQAEDAKQIHLGLLSGIDLCVTGQEKINEKQMNSRSTSHPGDVEDSHTMATEFI